MITSNLIYIIVLYKHFESTCEVILTTLTEDMILRMQELKRYVTCDHIRSKLNKAKTKQLNKIKILF